MEIAVVVVAGLLVLLVASNPVIVVDRYSTLPDGEKIPVAENYSFNDTCVIVPGRASWSKPNNTEALYIDLGAPIIVIGANALVVDERYNGTHTVICLREINVTPVEPVAPARPAEANCTGGLCSIIRAYSAALSGNCSAVPGLLRGARVNDSLGQILFWAVSRRVAEYCGGAGGSEEPAAGNVSGAAGLVYKAYLEGDSVLGLVKAHIVYGDPCLAVLPVLLALADNNYSEAMVYAGYAAAAECSGPMRLLLQDALYDLSKHTIMPRENTTTPPSTTRPAPPTAPAAPSPAATLPFTAFAAGYVAGLAAGYGVVKRIMYRGAPRRPDNKPPRQNQ